MIRGVETRSGHQGGAVTYAKLTLCFFSSGCSDIVVDSRRGGVRTESCSRKGWMKGGWRFDGGGWWEMEVEGGRCGERKA
jgi:hypothetical protein